MKICPLALGALFLAAWTVAPLRAAEPIRVLILDGQQNRNRFDFTNAQVNTNIDATKFMFTPLVGTMIVKP